MSPRKEKELARDHFCSFSFCNKFADRTCGIVVVLEIEASGSPLAYASRSLTRSN